MLSTKPLAMTSLPQSEPPSLKITSADGTTTSSPARTRQSPTSRTRSSSLLHKNVLSRMRPLPFQYVYSMWHSKANNTPSSLTQLADSIPDIASFYRIFNNFPWETGIPQRDSIHFFRAGVQPLWEEPENIDGGCWTIKVRREDSRALKAWEELCLMVLGGELQASVAQERDHILGLSYSPRLYWSHISIWTKKGGNQKSVEIVQKTILGRLSAELQPKTAADYYFKKHSEHEGWEDIVKVHS